MKHSVIFIFLFSICFSVSTRAQDRQLDSLIKTLDGAKNDTNKVNTFNLIAKKYFQTDPEKSIFYGLQSSALAKKLDYKKGLALAYKNTGIGYFYRGQYVDAVKSYELAVQTFDSLGDKKGVANIYSNMGNVYYNQGENVEALNLYLKALKYADESKDTLRMVTALINIGAIYGLKPKDYDKAIYYYQKAFPLTKAIGDNSTFGIAAVNIGEIYMNKFRANPTLSYRADSAQYYFDISLKAVDGTEDAPYTLNDMGELYMLLNNFDKAIEIQTRAAKLAKELDLQSDLAIALIGLGNSFKQKNDLSNAAAKFLEAEPVAKDADAKYSLEKIYKGLSDIYSVKKDFANAAKYQSLLLAVKDSIYNLESDKKLGTLSFNYELDKIKTDQEKKDAAASAEMSRQKIVRNSLIVGAILLLILALVIFNRYQLKQRSLSQLRAAQQQIIQQQKLASLGQLAAGVAHEIQNPLNFVNNFSQLSKELIEDAETSTDENERKEIFADLKNNMTKIEQYGKRADGIVKGMLEHSKAGKGEKTETDINQLCDQFPDLTFQSMKAADPTLECAIEKNLDASIPKVNVISNDISRAITNILNNAFFAVKGKPDAKVEVTTAFKNHQVEIHIKDNGVGIPANHREKILEPFYTTKPTGKGNIGLGLGISYDIITAHAGKIEFTSEEGRGTEFIIFLAA